jgi:hypothetical protein
MRGVATAALLGVVATPIVAQAPAEWLDLDSLGLTAPRRIAAASACDLWIVDDRGLVRRLQCDRAGGQGWSQRSIGAAGGGPGEYRYPWFAAVERDSLWLWDRQLGRLTPFALSTGAPGRSRSFATHVSGIDPSAVVVPVRGSDDVIAVFRRQSREPSGVRVTLVVQRLHEVRGVLRTLFEGADSGSVYWERSPLSGRFDAPFGLGISVHVSPARLTLLDRQAGTVRSISLADGIATDVPLLLPPAMTARPEHRRRYADSVRASITREAELLRYDAPLVDRFRRVYDDVLAELRYPRTLARLERVAVDEQRGRIAVAMASAADSWARDWIVQPLAGPPSDMRRRIPHRGAVLDAAFAGGCLITLERQADESVLMGRYCGW